MRDAGSKSPGWCRRPVQTGPGWRASPSGAAAGGCGGVPAARGRGWRDVEEVVPGIDVDQRLRPRTGPWSRSEATVEFLYDHLVEDVAGPARDGRGRSSQQAGPPAAAGRCPAPGSVSWARRCPSATRSAGWALAARAVASVSATVLARPGPDRLAPPGWTPADSWFRVGRARRGLRRAGRLLRLRLDREEQFAHCGGREVGGFDRDGVPAAGSEHDPRRG